MTNTGYLTRAPQQAEYFFPTKQFEHVDFFDTFFYIKVFKYKSKSLCTHLFK
jgi:hypothetical protein